MGEIGDKTQLLALVLAARFQKPLPIIAGILTATLFNHALAGLLGNMVRSALPPDALRWVVAISFFAVALWALKPDTLAGDTSTPMSRWGVFGVTTIAFFLAEIGDKTQVATMVLASLFLLALSMFGSTFLPTLTNGAVAFTLFGLGWLSGVIQVLGDTLKNDSLLNLGTTVALFIPSDMLWRSASYYVQSASILAATSALKGALPILAP